MTQQAKLATPQRVPQDNPTTAPAFGESLFEFAPDAILVVGNDGKIIRANPMVEKLFGYASGELVGEAVERLVPSRFHHRHVGLRSDYSHAPRPRQMGAGLDLYAIRKDGSEFAVEVALGPQKVDGQDLVLCIVRDITERRQAEAALRRAHNELEHRVVERTRELQVANKQLEHSNRELQDFAYVASHDLQEPLRKIQAFGERLSERAGNALDETARDYLARMQNASSRMQRLINDLLSFSRVTTKAQPFVLVDLQAIAKEVISDLEVAIEEAQAKVEVSALTSIEAEPMQMRQLLQNLIGNALKFRQPDRQHVVKVRGEQRDNVFELVVEDNGIGFDEKYRERIFGLFQRLHGRNEYPGSGVGLAICRKIAERHNGTISAEGKIGAGAKFTVLLPITQISLEGSK
jgi:two-component system sensor kinase FixL